MILDDFKKGEIVYFIGGYQDMDDTYDFLSDGCVDKDTIEYTIKDFKLKTYKIHNVTGDGHYFGKEYDEKTKKLVKTKNGFNRESLPSHRIFKTKKERSEYLANWFIELYVDNKEVENFNFDRDIIFKYKTEITAPFYDIIMSKIPESLI